MDPAILSFRQFSSFPHQGQMPPLHQQQQDLLLQHLAQNQQQNGQGKCLLKYRKVLLFFVRKVKALCLQNLFKKLYFLAVHRF